MYIVKPYKEEQDVQRTYTEEGKPSTEVTAKGHKW